MSNLRCKNCGAELSEGALFCNQCQAAVITNTATEPDVQNFQTQYIVSDAATQNEPVVEKKLNNNLIKAVVIGVAAVVIVLLVLLISGAFSSSDYIKLDKDEIFVYSVGDGEDQRVIIERKGKDNIQIKGKYYFARKGIDGKSGIVGVIEDTSEEDNQLITVYDFNGKKLVDKVSSCILASNGLSFTYIVEDEDNETAALFLYNKGKSSKLADDAFYITISPDGKAVTYCSETENSEGESVTIGYYYDGKTHELGKNIKPLAISNGAKLIYYVKEDSLYVQKGTDLDTRVKLGDYTMIDGMTYNSDKTECLIKLENDDGELKPYITVDGKKKVSLKGTGEYIYTLTPTSATACKTFAKSFYTVDNATCYIDGKFESRKVLSNVENPFLADDCKTIIYKKDSSIYKIDGTDEDAESIELIEDEASYIIGFNEDASAFFYINVDDEIMFKKGNKKPKIVTDEFDSCGFGLFNGKTLYYIANDRLYSSNGDQGEPVKGFNVEGIENIEVAEGYVILLTVNEDEGEAVYISRDGKNFTKRDRD